MTTSALSYKLADYLIIILSLSRALIVELANRANEVAHKEPSHLYPHSLPSSFRMLNGQNIFEILQTKILWYAFLRFKSYRLRGLHSLRTAQAPSYLTLYQTGIPIKFESVRSSLPPMTGVRTHDLQICSKTFLLLI